MKKELSPFEVYIRNQIKKQKDEEDQKFLDNMLMELKKKNEAEKQQQIDNLTKNLENIRG